MSPAKESLSHYIASHLGHGAARVVWTDAGDEVLLHLDRLSVRRSQGILVVRVDLEADEVGRENVTLPFALGEGSDEQLFATTVETVAGGPLAERWGAILQNAIFRALSSLRHDRRKRRCAVQLDAIVARRGARG